MVRCTPVVCTGGPPKVARPPNKSDRLPKAVRLVRAFNAPGLANNWANGMAEANELAAAAKGFVSGVGVVLDDVVDDVLLLVFEFKTLVVVFIGDDVDDDDAVVVLVLFEILLLNVDVVFKLFVFVVLLVLLLLLLLLLLFGPPFVAAVVPLTVAAALFASWRFAFCNSTL